MRGMTIDPAPVARRALLLGLAAMVTFGGCYREAPAGAPEASPEQRIIDASADALERMRRSGRFPMLEEYLANARGVMIFPHVVKASFIFGGEGGSGVLLARTGGARRLRAALTPR